MKDLAVPYNEFDGILTSIHQAPVNSFKTLINLTHDIVINAITTRKGYRTAKDFLGANVTTSKPIIIFQQIPFRDITPYLFLGSNFLTSKPSIISDAVVDEEVNLLESIVYADTTNTTFVKIGSVSSATISVNWTGNKSTLKYTIVFNKSRGNYAVVKSISAGNLVLNRVVNDGISTDSNWQVGDVLRIYRSDIVDSTFTLLSSPQFNTVSPSKEQILSGIVDNDFNTSYWIGRILNRNYFNNGFSYNGIYCTSVLTDFKNGSFRNDYQHLQVKFKPAVDIAITTRLNPITDVVNTGWNKHGQSTFCGCVSPLTGSKGDPTPGTDKDSSVTDYVSANGSGTLKPLTMIFSSFSGAVDITSNIVIDIWAQVASGSNGQISVSLLDSAGVEYYRSKSIMMGGWRMCGFSIPISEILNKIDFTNFRVQINATVSSLSSREFDISYVAAYIPSYSYSPIQLIATTNFIFSVALQMDGFNLTSLIYNKQYGVISPASTDIWPSNMIQLTTVDNGIVVVRITVPHPELLNRRATALELYGAKIGAGADQIDPSQLVFRLCTSISMNDSGWIFDGINYYIDVPVGDEINTGTIYSSRTNAATADIDLQKIKFMTSLNGRSFVVNDTDNQIVYFSSVSTIGLMTSTIPKSNFILFNKTPGDIVALESINSNLIVFKKFSLSVVNVSGLPYNTNEVFTDTENGLASFYSIAKSSRFLYYCGYDGVYSHDGFKKNLINIQWIDQFRAYTQAQIEASVGFFNSFTQSYYLCIDLDVWVLDTKTSKWHQEAYGRQVKYATKQTDGRTLFSDELGQQVFEYPRADDLYKDTVDIDTIDTDVSVKAWFETNDHQDHLDYAVYLNKFFLIADNFPNISVGYLRFNRGSTTVIALLIKKNDRQIYILKDKVPFDRFSVYMYFETFNQVKVKEFNLDGKILLRTGSIKSFENTQPSPPPVTIPNMGDQPYYGFQDGVFTGTIVGTLVTLPRKFPSTFYMVVIETVGGYGADYSIVTDRTFIVSTTADGVQGKWVAFPII